MAEEQQEERDPFQQAADEAATYMDQYDAKYKAGGKLAQEEREKADVAAPAPVDQETEPAAGPTPESAPAPIDPWAAPNEAEPKWKDAQEAKKGYHHAIQMAKAALAERDALKAQIGQQRAPTAPVAVAGEGAPNPWEELGNYGVPKEPLEQAIEQAAERKLLAILTPMAQEAQAQQYMQRKYGEQYVKLQPELEVFTQSDPEVQGMVQLAKNQGQHQLAEEWRLLKYLQARGAQVEESIKANQEVRKEIVEEQRKDAAIVGAKRTEGRDTKPEDAPLEGDRFEQLKTEARMGYGNRLWRETIGKGLPDEVFQ